MEVKIFSNWNFDDEDKLKNLLTFSTPGNKECPMEHVTPESCICLTKGENASADSKPEVEIKSANVIKEINILSEGSLIEVFGVNDEYLCTCASEFIDDWEEMAVYHANIIIPGVNVCKLKFTRIKENGRLWLYSIQLSVTKPEEPSHLLFNFDNVNKFINNPGHQMSEKAEQFRKLFELYAKNSSASQCFSVQNLLNVINRECNLQYLDCKQSLTNRFDAANIFSGNVKLHKESEGTNGNELSAECQFLKNYIDVRLKEIKDDLMMHVDISLQEFKNESSAKLDRIIGLLENSKLSH